MLVVTNSGRTRQRGAGLEIFCRVLCGVVGEGGGAGRGKGGSGLRNRSICQAYCLLANFLRRPDDPSLSKQHPKFSCHFGLCSSRNPVQEDTLLALKLPYQGITAVIAFVCGVARKCRGHGGFIHLPGFSAAEVRRVWKQCCNFISCTLFETSQPFKQRARCCGVHAARCRH